MDKQALLVAADAVRRAAAGVRVHGHPGPAPRLLSSSIKPSALADALDRIAGGLEHALGPMRLTVEADQSMWKLAPKDARAEMVRRLNRLLSNEVAVAVNDDRAIKYTRYNTDGEIAASTDAGKKIARHVAEASLIVMKVEVGDD